MNEYALIRKLFGSDVPDLFGSDAQFFDVAGERWGVTCDAFSPEEDCFTLENPRRLGANLVVATLSDLYASGCRPAFFEQAVTFPRDATAAWLADFAGGVRGALAEADCRLLGGDTGQGVALAYTGIALGPQVQKISRHFPVARQDLYVTGHLGALNAAAFTGSPTPALVRRPTPSTATSCIDTSSGFMDAVWQLHELNPRHAIRVARPPVENVAYLFGGAGEYELLFTAPPGAPVPAGAVRVGEVVPDAAGVTLDGHPVMEPPPDPRSFTGRADYVAAILEQVKGLS